MSNQAETVETLETVETKKRARAISALIKGRAPAPIVYAVRFGEFVKDSNISELATLFGTTVGKINDILKGNNFSYITEATRFTHEQIQDADEYISNHPNYDEVGADAVLEFIRALPVATEEEAAQFLADRKAARKTSTSKVDEVETVETVEAETVEAETVEAETEADDLLS